MNMTDSLLYKWEDSPGLEHGCGQCGTPLSSPKARKICFGKHCEPCIKYHAALHWVGKAHNCLPCRRSNELHEERHREIARMMIEIRKLDEDSDHLFMPTQGSRRKPRHSLAEPDQPTRDQDEDDDDADVEDAITVTTTGSHNEEKTKFHTPAKIKRLHKKAVKAEKSRQKALRSQNRVKVITADDVKGVAEAIHGPAALAESSGSRTIVEDEIVRQSIAYQSAMRKQYRSDAGRETIGEKRERKTREKRFSMSPKAEDVDAILSRLDVRVSVEKATKERRSMVAKLKDGIRNDIDIVLNEEREIIKRKAGYWRYVSKRTYNEMVENNQIVDWKTGEKLATVEEEDEGDAVEEGADAEEVAENEEEEDDDVGGAAVMAEAEESDHEENAIVRYVEGAASIEQKVEESVAVGSVGEGTVDNNSNDDEIAFHGIEGGTVDDSDSSWENIDFKNDDEHTDDDSKEATKAIQNHPSISQIIELPAANIQFTSAVEDHSESIQEVTSHSKDEAPVEEEPPIQEEPPVSPPRPRGLALRDPDPPRTNNPANKNDSLDDSDSDSDSETIFYSPCTDSDSTYYSASDFGDSEDGLQRRHRRLIIATLCEI